MPWYSQYMTKLALRKNSLNADLHIHSLENPNNGLDAPDEDQYRHLLDILGSAILKGLDIIGIVSRFSFRPGMICKQIIQEKNYDIVCLAGVEVVSEEDIHVVVYDSDVIPKSGLPIENICRIAHKHNGVVMAIQPSRRNIQKLNKLVNTSSAPDFIEIFNDITQGGYSKSFVDTSPDPGFQLTMNSAARNAKDLDTSMMLSRIPRKFLVSKGVLQPDQGTDFVPEYLQNQDYFEQNQIQRNQGVV